MHMFTTLFLLFLAAGLSVQLWLGARHRRHVLAHRPEVPAAFADKVSLEEHQKAADYTLTRSRFGSKELIYGALLLLFWTLGGGIQLLSGLWSGLGLDPLITGTALILSLFLISSLLDLPFDLWRTFRIEAAFGFNRTTPGRFIKDLLLQFLLSLLLGVPLLWVMLWLMQESGAYWWFYAWLVWLGFTLLMTWVFPTLIAPIFNKFTPLEDEALQQRLQALVERCGFASKGVFVMDGSRRSSHGNAYFTGIGRSKRIVFFDTLLENLQPDEVEAVLAHELGHFKLRHVRKGLLMMATSSLLGLALLGWIIQQPWFFSGLGVSEPSNAAALLLFMMVTPVFTFFLQPPFSLYQRRHEFEADDFAVEQSDAQSMINALVKLYRDNANTLTPDPLYSAFYDSHPPAPVRVRHLASIITAYKCAMIHPHCSTRA